MGRGLVDRRRHRFARGGAQHVRARCGGQRDDEAAALPRALGARLDPAPVAAHQVTDDEQAEAEARRLTLDVATGAVEALEDLAQLAALDPDALVGDLRQHAAFAALAQRHPHVDRRLGVLDRVLEQVPEHHAELGGVAERTGRRFLPHPDCVGPGSPWLVEAKRQLSHRIALGTPAGPSESIILADASANPEVCALDLIVESEHGPDSSAFLVTHDAALADAARAAVPRYWGEMGPQRVEFSSTVLGGEQGGIVLAPDFDAALEFVNDYAPEHLEIQSAEPFAHLGRIRHAGEILLGSHTPVTLGNFVLGPNAVLPTSAAARTASPLSVFDYLRRQSVGYVTSTGYETLAPVARRFATYEGFDGHANAVSELRDAALANKP